MKRVAFTMRLRPGGLSEYRRLHDGIWPELVALTSTNPARRFGLAPRKGELAPGADGDVVVFDPAVERTISAATHASASDYDCYEGWTVRGAPRTVLSRGEVVVRDGAVVSRAGRGRYVKRDCVED